MNYHLYRDNILKNPIILSLIIIIITGGIWAGYTLPQISHDSEVAASNLATEQSRVLALKNSLASTQNNLKETVSALTGKTSQLDESQDALTRVENDLTATQARLEISQYQLSQVQDQLATVQGQLTIALNNSNTVKNESNPPRPFNSVQEAQEWLDNHQLPVVLITNQSGIINFSQPQSDSRHDCDDYARDYQQLALKSGYIINLCPVENGEVWGIKVSLLPEAHIACWVQIDNTYYYIESVPNLPNSYQLTRIIDAD